MTVTVSLWVAGLELPRVRNPKIFTPIKYGLSTVKTT